jgi:hypothetical protein
MILDIHPDPGSGFCSILDPEVKKAQGPGSGSLLCIVPVSVFPAFKNDEKSFSMYLDEKLVFALLGAEIEVILRSDLFSGTSYKINIFS